MQQYFCLPAPEYGPLYFSLSDFNHFLIACKSLMFQNPTRASEQNSWYIPVD